MADMVGRRAGVSAGRRATEQQQRALSRRPQPGVAFAFDIDGVLLRGKTPIPGASAALHSLLDPATGAPAVPFCFITNGGGVSEADKAAELGRLLDLPPAAVSPGQVILAHSPFKDLATAAPVLVIGGKQSLAVARDCYGFTAAASPAQVAAAGHPAQLPLRPPHSPADVGRLPTCPTSGAPAGSPAFPFTAVLVMYDPECWHTDVQVTLDVLAGRGVSGGWRLGTRPPATRPFLPVHFSNGDVLWANEHPAPRLGQGAFAAALRAVVSATGQGDILSQQLIYGKPTPWPYRLADAALAGQALKLASSPSSDPGWRKTGIRAVVAVGDNPAADVAGAAAAGEPWVPALVCTGVHAGPGNCPVNPAAVVVEDVEAAVEWGWRLGRESARAWGV